MLLARSILADIENGFAGAVIDPKADLIETILNRIKPEDADRIVVLDPGRSRPAPRRGVARRWRPRSARRRPGRRAAFGVPCGGVGRAHRLLPAARHPHAQRGPRRDARGHRRLFFEEPFRRAALARLRDPFLIAAWQSYAALSVGSQAEHLQAPMARIMALLSRPRVRAVLASPDPKLDVAAAVP